MLNALLDDLLEQGVIIPSSLPWASPVVLVAKKDSSEGPRFCIPYTPYIGPIARVSNVPHAGKFRFHQLLIHPDNREKTVFVVIEVCVSRHICL